MKRGQFDLSFGMIFSIVIIIAIIGVSIYVIMHFMNLNSCAQVGLTFKELQDRVDKAYQADKSREAFSGKVPRGVDEVCFGDLNKQPLPAYAKEYKELGAIKIDQNMFIYPPYKACDTSISGFKLKYVNVSSLFCVPAIDGKINVNLVKETYEPFVRIEK